MVKTAVLVASYNGEHFIGEQLESIRNQTLAPDYVLFRDDCSSDNTVAFIEDYIKKHQLDNWKISVNKSNVGWRRNFKALMQDVLDVDCDYIFFSDQDDQWYLDKNQKQVQIMEENPTIELLSADIDIKKMSEDASIPNNFQFSDAEKPLSKYPADFSSINYRQGWTFCMRRSLIEDCMRYYGEDLLLSHDNLIAGVARVMGVAYNYNRPVGVHKRHGKNASGNLLNIRSPHQRHMEDLKFVLSYYTVLKNVLKQRNLPELAVAENYYHFYKKRYDFANSRNFFGTIHQMLTQGTYYDSWSNRLRDAIFLFKK